MIYTILWLAWGLYFAVVEGFALANSKRGDTLSEHIWAWFGTDRYGEHQPTGWVKVRRFALLAFLAWLVTHFLTGGWV